MLQRRRVYFDNAATSWPKPTRVYDVVDDYQRRIGASVGRGGYTEAREAGLAVEATRAALARLIGAASPDQIVFTLNGTDSLNLAIHGILKPGDHVVTTVLEHNSVLRPLRRLEKGNDIEVTRVGCDEFGNVDPVDIRLAIRPNTKLIVVTHASNVTGVIQPVAEIGAIARERGILFLVDAAQTLGHLPLSVSELAADLVAAPGHKGLLGPLGTGILYIRPGVEVLVDCLRQGGTGSASSSDDQPERLPDKYESGSHNAPGIIGLGAGVEYLQQRGLADIRQHTTQLTEQLLAGLSDIRGVEVHGPRSSSDRIGVVSVTFADQDTPSVANRLEEDFRIQVRGGFQCAALLHRSLGTFEQQGTVRFSVGPFNTADDIDAAIEAARTIAGSPRTMAQPVACPCVASVREQDQATHASSLVLPVAAEISSVATPSRNSTNVADIPGLRELWNETLGDPRICIAILDGPVDLSHPCFQGADIAVHPPSVVTPNKGIATQHGTHVASVIFGQHHSEVKGIAPNCHGVIIPVFRDGPDGEVVPCSQIDLARAITVAHQYAKDRGATAMLINISGGQFSPSGEAHPLLGDVVNSLSPDLHLIVSAAGNQGCDCLHIPGALPTVLAVGAMGRGGNPLAFSNWGKSYRAQGILAIGEDVQGANVAHGSELRTGTSYATPIVTGVAALLLSVQLKRSGFASADRVRFALIKSAIDCEQEPVNDCRRLLAGRLDVRSALSTLIEQGTTDMTDDRQLDTPASEQITAQSHEPIVSSASRIPHARHEFQAAPVSPLSSENSGCPVTGSQFNSKMVLPAGCGCAGGNGAAMQKVYAIGKLSFDYGTRQRREYFRNVIGGDPDNAANLYIHLTGRETLEIVDAKGNATGVKTKRSDLYRTGIGDNHEVHPTDQRLHPNGVDLRLRQYAMLNGPRFTDRSDVTSLTWTLEIDGTPVYAIAPAGAFAFEGHNTLLEFLRSQLPGVPDDPNKFREGVLYGEGATRMALPGYIAGETQLYTGERVPVVIPDQRGLANWNPQALYGAIFDSISDTVAHAEDIGERILDRLHELTRNLGVESQDRALNYAATDAVMLLRILTDPKAASKLSTRSELNTINVEPSPICRPGYDCWDVVIIFFDPENLTRSRLGVRYTIDVSDVLPQIVANSERIFTLT